VFDGLLPDEHNKILLDLLFTLATWHAYAKLRLHTDTTLAFFDTVTSILGEQLWYFLKTTCEAFQTKETPSEVASRARRNAQKANSSGSGTTGAQQRGLNLSTYKLHALGHYPDTIRRFGTTESYSTQTVRPYSIIQVSKYYIYIYRASCSIIEPSAASRELTSEILPSRSPSRTLARKSSPKCSNE